MRLRTEWRWRRQVGSCCRAMVENGRTGKTVAKKETGEKPICQNKRARINYFIDETYEAGIALVGTEVKALRDGRANLKDSYALIKEGELFL